MPGAKTPEFGPKTPEFGLNATSHPALRRMYLYLYFRAAWNIVLQTLVHGITNRGARSSLAAHWAHIGHYQYCLPGFLYH